jgi:hypothetical protein
MKQTTAFLFTRRTGALVAALAGSACSALAGGGAENALIIADPTSSESMYVANYYKKARNIPPENFLYVDPDALNYAESAGPPLDGFLGHLQQRAIRDHIDYVIVCPGPSFYVNAANYVKDGCFPVTRFSMPSIFTMAYLRDLILTSGGNLSSQTVNQYFSQDMTKPLAFDSETLWKSGLPSTAIDARQYFIGAMLGYTGPNGNTLVEVLDMIDRSVLADGVRPGGAGGGTFYLMNNTGDPARNVRAVQYSSAAPGFTANGGVSQTIAGELPIGSTDVLGVVAGFAAASIKNANMTLLPGSFADHLTSYAATFDIPDQTKCSQWISKGASGTAGTVEEPCNYQGKFPHTRSHVYYLQGMSLGEAWYRGALYVPFQVMFLGDPLTRVFTHIPMVSVADAPAGPVGGVIQLTPSGSTTKPGLVMQTFHLLIDGVFHSSVLPGQKFSLNTADLSDGYHELRVLGFDNSLTKSMGRWIGSINTSNQGVTSTLTKVTQSGSLTNIFQVQVASQGGTPGETRLLSNGRVVASRQGDGPIFMWGMNLGAGDAVLQSETFFSDGRVARSAPITLPITYATGTPSALKAVVFSYTKDIDKAHPAIVELPATMDTDPALATYEILTPPAQAQVAFGTKGYRVIYPDSNAKGTDTVVWRVTTPNGVSNNAVLTLRYDKPVPCYADCDLSGTLTIDDFICFQTLFALGDPGADCDATGTLTIDDFICFQTFFAIGC